MKRGRSTKVVNWTWSFHDIILFIWKDLLYFMACFVSYHFYKINFLRTLKLSSWPYFLPFFLRIMVGIIFKWDARDCAISLTLTTVLVMLDPACARVKMQVQEIISKDSLTHQIICFRMWPTHAPRLLEREKARDAP